MLKYLLRWWLSHEFHRSSSAQSPIAKILQDKGILDVEGDVEDLDVS